MSNIFGNLGGATSKPNPFGATTTAPQQSSIFGQSTGTSNLFGASQPQQTSNIFGTAQPQQSTGSIFGNLGNNQSQQQTGSIFGTTTTQPQQSSIFGTAPKSTFTGFGFGGTQAQQQTTNTAPNPFASTSIASQPFGGGFAGQQQQPQQGSTNWSGNASTQQPLQQQPQPLQRSRIWSEQDSTIRQTSVTDQIDLIYSKWNPDSINSSFHTYLYNTFSTDTAAFFRPGPDDNEEKWEEALRNRPGPGAIPFKLKGFYQLGQRLITQGEHLRVLRGRLLEINNGLTDLLNKHEVSIVTRTAECRRKHAALSQKCLALATKTQVLKNRGYAMDVNEEELRQKLQALERKMMDPDLNGRAEEIWARMVSVRERGRQLQYEMERHGISAGGEEQGLDEDVLKRVRKILEDYNVQLTHLAKELEQIRKDFVEWESSKGA